MAKELTNIIELAEPDLILKHYKKFQDFKKKVLGKNDIVSINNKPFIVRTGWQKIALAFNLSTKIIKEECQEKSGYFVWRIWVEARAPNGRTTVGDGACASNERAFAHLEHDVYATAHTRAECRAISNIVGSGELSAEEIQYVQPEKVPPINEAYCSCIQPKPNDKGVCGFCNKLTKQQADKLKARLQ